MCFPSNFSLLYHHDDVHLLDPGRQPPVQVLLEVLHAGERRYQEGPRAGRQFHVKSLFCCVDKEYSKCYNWLNVVSRFSISSV